MKDFIGQFSINTYFIVFMIIFTIRHLVEIKFKPNDKNRDNPKKKGKFDIFVFTSLYLLSGTAVYIILLSDSETDPILFILGIVIYVSAFVSRFIVLAGLGKNYSLYINNTQSDTLITIGIYRVIRHPLYLLYAVEMSAFLLIKFNLFSLTALVLDLLMTVFRIKDEERQLLSHFEEEYENYKRKTWRMIPFFY